MIYLLIAAGLCFLVAIIIFFSIPPHGGDGYIGQGLISMFAFIASLVFLALSLIVWLYNHLTFVQ